MDLLYCILFYVNISTVFDKPNLAGGPVSLSVLYEYSKWVFILIALVIDSFSLVLASLS